MHIVDGFLALTLLLNKYLTDGCAVFKLVDDLINIGICHNTRFWQWTFTVVM